MTQSDNERGFDIPVGSDDDDVRGFADIAVELEPPPAAPAPRQRRAGLCSCPVVPRYIACLFIMITFGGNPIGIRVCLCSIRLVGWTERGSRKGFYW
jgi:hypothetical protein